MAKLAGLLLILAVSAALATGCRKPSENDCQEVVDRYLAMTTADPPKSRDLEAPAKEALRAAVIARRKADDSYTQARRRCVDELSASEIECLKQAPNADLWEACIE